MKIELEKERGEIISQMTAQQNILDTAKDQVDYLKKKLKLVSERLAKLDDKKPEVK